MVDIIKRGRLSSEDEEVSSYISGFDKWWFKPHLWVDQAHTIMLGEQGIISEDDANALLTTYEEIEQEGFNALPERSGLHVAIEEQVVEKLGEEIGGKMHTARSRNDKGATAMRIGIRWEILDLLAAILKIRSILLERAEESSEYLVSGYTHLQNAQPTTVGHHLMAHAERLSRDFDRLVESYHRTNVNPLGSGALAGTGYDIDRFITTEMMGFEKPTRNSMDSVSTRDFCVDITSAAAMTGTDISCICEDIYIWSTSEFDFIELADAHAGTSSIMPQKKNPDYAEIARSRAGTMSGLVSASLNSLKGLPMAFNYDIVEANSHAKKSLDLATRSTEVIAAHVESMEFNKKNMSKGASKGFSTATELADTLVREGGVSFRTAHHIVGQLARDLKPSEINTTAIDEVSEDIVDQPLNISQDSINKALDPQHNVEVRDSYGGPGEIDDAISDGQDSLQEQYEYMKSLEEELSKSKGKIQEEKSKFAD